MCIELDDYETIVTKGALRREIARLQKMTTTETEMRLTAARKALEKISDPAVDELRTSPADSFTAEKDGD